MSPCYCILLICEPLFSLSPYSCAPAGVRDYVGRQRAWAHEGAPLRLGLLGGRLRLRRAARQHMLYVPYQSARVAQTTSGRVLGGK